MPELNVKKATTASTRRPKSLASMPSALLLGGMALVTVTSTHRIHEGDDIPTNYRRAAPRPAQMFATWNGDEIALSEPPTDRQFSEIVVSPAKTPALSPALQAAQERLSWLASLEDGWQGQGSRSTSTETKEDATSLLEKLAAELPHGPLPMLGMDSEGYIVMTWNEGELVCSLSVFGDGTYAFFAQRNGITAKSGDARISDPVPSRLIEILTA